jgi:hypothetical protein
MSMSSPEPLGGCVRVVEPVPPARPRKPPTRRRRSLGVAAAVARTRRQCAHGPAPMDTRSAIAVESPVTSWKTSPPAPRSRQPQTQNRQCRGVRRPLGHVHQRPATHGPAGPRWARAPVAASRGLRTRLHRPARPVDHRDPRRHSAGRSVDPAFGTTMSCRCVLHRSWQRQSAELARRGRAVRQACSRLRASPTGT